MVILSHYHLYLHALAFITQTCKGKKLKGPQTFHGCLKEYICTIYAINLWRWGMISFSTWKSHNCVGPISKMVPAANSSPSWWESLRPFPLMTSNATLGMSSYLSALLSLKKKKKVGERTKKVPSPLGIQRSWCDLLKIKSSFPASCFTCVIKELRTSTLLRFFNQPSQTLYPKHLQSKRKILSQRTTLVRQQKLLYSTGISFSMNLFVQFECRTS